MTLPYLSKENPFENILKIETEENFNSSIEALKKDLSDSIPTAIYDFFYKQGSALGNTNLQRLFDALINVTKKHAEKIAGVTLLILQILKADVHEIMLIPIEKILLHQRVKLSIFSTQTKLRLLINSFMSNNYSNEKLKDLLIFLVKSFVGTNYSEDVQLLSMSRTIDRRSLLTIEICQKETPRFIYHAFFTSLRQLYYSTPLINDAEKIMGNYLEKYLREITIVELLEFQNNFRGAVHKLLENKKETLQFISQRIKDAEKMPVNFNETIEELEKQKQLFLFNQSLTADEKQLMVKAKMLITAFENNEAHFEEVRIAFKKESEKVSISNPILQKLADKINHHILPCISPGIYSGIVTSTREAILYSTNNYLLGYAAEGAVVHSNSR